LSTSGITSSLLAQIADSPSAANQFVTDLNQLAQDLKSGNLSAAQQDFVTLSQDALNGATSSTANTSTSGITTTLLSDVLSTATGGNAFASELNQLGTDLENGDLSSAQSDMLSLDSSAQNAAPSASSTASTANQAETAALIHAIIEGLGRRHRHDGTGFGLLQFIRRQLPYRRQPELRLIILVFVRLPQPASG